MSKLYVKGGEAIPCIMDEADARKICRSEAASTGRSHALIEAEMGGYLIVPAAYVAEPDFTDRLRRSVAELEESHG